MKKLTETFNEIVNKLAVRNDENGDIIFKNIPVNDLIQAVREYNKEVTEIGQSMVTCCSSIDEIKEKQEELL